MDEKTLEKLEEYLKMAEAMATFKEKTGAAFVGMFEPFLKILEKFNQENNVAFEIPELQEKSDQINFFDIQPFVDRFAKFIEESK